MPAYFFVREAYFQVREKRKQGIYPRKLKYIVNQFVSKQKGHDQNGFETKKNGFEIVWNGFEIPRIHFEEDRLPFELVFYCSEMPIKHIVVNDCGNREVKGQHHPNEISCKLFLKEE